MNEKRRKNIITYGNFDLLHYGHIRLLTRAKALGDHLIVALSTDQFSTECKNKKCVLPYEERKALLETLKCVDQIIPETCWEQKQTDITDYDIDVFVIGDDWKGKFDYLKAYGVQVVYLPRTPEISTTNIKKAIRSNDCE